MDNEQLARQEEYRETTIELLSQIVTVLNKISLREYKTNQRLTSIESELKSLEFLREDTLATKEILLETKAGAKYKKRKEEEALWLRASVNYAPSNNENPS